MLFPQMLDLLAQQVASPVQFVKGLNTLYDAGARVFVEVGPKKALQGFAEEVLGERGDVVSLFTNHPKVGDIPAFNQALCATVCGGTGPRADRSGGSRFPSETCAVAIRNCHPSERRQTNTAGGTAQPLVTAPSSPSNGNRYNELGRLFAEALERAGWQIHQGEKPATDQSPGGASRERLWVCPEPSTSSTMATSNASCAAINSSAPSRRASARTCSTSTSGAW